MPEMNTIKPRYIHLYKEGIIQQRADELIRRLSFCNTCPRKCGVNRLKDERGFCHSGYLPLIAAYCSHNGEEPVISGVNGSGTIFLGNCNMRCVYCQNYQISQNYERLEGKEINFTRLAEIMIYLQNVLKCHNINFVSPSHFVPQIVHSIMEAIPMGLHVPLIYNTSSYDSLDSLRMLEGIFDIYLPDIRYADNIRAEKFSSAPNYVEISRQAIKEMYRQTGDLVLDDSGMAVKGVIIRHLVLPNGLAGSRDSLMWVAKELSMSVTISIMSQYIPIYKASNFPELARCITEAELDEVIQIFTELDLENGWMQEKESANIYVPDFNNSSNPFINNIIDK